MREEKDKMDNKQVMLKTRVSASVFARLMSICKAYGMTIYVMLRMLIDCIVRYMDQEHNLSEDLQRVIRMFEGMEGWSRSICLADGIEDMEIVEAFYVLGSKTGKGTRVVHVVRPVMDGDAHGWSATYNIQRMLERFMELTNKSLYKHIRSLGIALGTESFLDTMHTIVNMYQENPYEAEMRLTFQNNDWHEGAKVVTDTRYKRQYFHDSDYVERESMKQGTLFDNVNEN